MPLRNWTERARGFTMQLRGNMKISFCVLLLLIGRCCFGQSDSNLLAAGDWSKIVTDDAGHALRGRLLVYDDNIQGSAGHARVYLELQHVFQGGWDLPVEFYFDVNSGSDLRLEVRDAANQSVPPQPINMRSFRLPSYWVTVPCDATVKLRADLYADSIGSRPGNLVILQSSGCWIIPRNTTKDYYLTGTFIAAPKPSAIKYDEWWRILYLPAVKISGGP
jgi:hypothetical protein